MGRRRVRWGATTDVANHGNVLCSPLRRTNERRHVRRGAATDVATHGNVLSSPLRRTHERGHLRAERPVNGHAARGFGERATNVHARRPTYQAETRARIESIREAEPPGSLNEPMARMRRPGVCEAASGSFGNRPEAEREAHRRQVSGATGRPPVERALIGLPA